MIDTILPVILSISSLVAVFTGVFISIRSVKKRREIEFKLSKELIEQKMKSMNNDDTQKRILEIENELKRTIDILNKMQIDLEEASEHRHFFDKAKYVRNTKYEKYLLEINEAMKKIDSKNKHLLKNALNQESNIGKIRYLERLTKEVLLKNEIKLH
ncbi:hypothetical protein [Pectobacterium versatile]|uniref:hypothetical protein n=1 Tax=Pectobacterium versatile TaxID=2488639 RepID=UPI001F3FE6EB|nr:hypothetical protein [Pectobacterium versatile]